MRNKTKVFNSDVSTFSKEQPFGFSHTMMATFLSFDASSSKGENDESQMKKQKKTKIFLNALQMELSQNF